MGEVNEIELASFLEGYNIKKISCVDETIATIVGNYERELYFYYCALYAILLNWSEKPGRGVFLENASIILDMLGMKLNKYNTNDLGDAYNIIKNKVDNNTLTFIISQYNRLFFSEKYKHEDDNRVTAVIVNGYDELRELVMVMDMSIARQYISTIYPGELFVKLQMPKEIFNSIWSKALEDFSCYTDTGTVYSIEKENDSISNKQIIEFWLEKLNHNKLEKEIYEYVNWIEKDNYSFNDYLQYLNSSFVAPLDMLFDFLNEYVKVEKNKYCKELEELRTDYIEQRKRIINIISKYAIREKLLPDEKKENLISITQEDDRRLKDYILKILKWDYII